MSEPRSILIPQPTPDQRAYLARILAAEEFDPAKVIGGRPAEPVKRWPFAESPGDLANRIFDLYDADNRGRMAMLAAVRAVLIENPPALAPWLDPGAAAEDSAKYNLLTIALRAAFPHFQGDAPITPEAVLVVGNDWSEMTIGRKLSPSEIKFLDDDGNEWTINRYPDRGEGWDSYWALEDGAVVMTEEEAKGVANPPISINVDAARERIRARELRNVLKNILAEFERATLADACAEIKAEAREAIADWDAAGPLPSPFREMPPPDFRALGRFLREYPDGGVGRVGYAIEEYARGLSEPGALK